MCKSTWVSESFAGGLVHVIVLLAHYKGLYLVYPFLGETRQEAKAQHQRLVTEPSFIEAAIAGIGQITDIDFSQYDLDKRSRAPKRSLSLQTPPLITFFNCTYGR